MSRPIVFAVPADIELAADPICRDWILNGSPQARSRRLAQSADGTASVMAWSCSAGSFKWHYAVDETLHIISGEVFVTDEKGDVRRLGPGDMAFFPAGSCSIWQVPVEVKKLAVCRHVMPRPFGTALRAWNKLVQCLFGGSVVRTGLGSDTTAAEPRSEERFIAGARGERAAA